MADTNLYLNKQNKVIKMPSVKSGPFKQGTSNNRVDFELPEGKSYDFSKSYINFYMTITSEDIANGNAGAIYLPELRHKDKTASTAAGVDIPHRYDFENYMLVQNCRLETSNYGDVEDIRRNDILRKALKQYGQTQSKKLSHQYEQASQQYERTGIKGSLFRTLTRFGDTTSRELTTPLRVYLSELFTFGAATNFNTSQMGVTRLFTELNLEALMVNTVIGFPTTDTEGAHRVKTGIADDLLFEDVAAGDVVRNVITTKKEYLNLEESPYYVGQKLHLTGVGLANFYPIIQKIEWSGNTRKLQLTIDSNMPAGNFANFNAFATVADAVPGSWGNIQIDDAELILEELPQVTPMDSQTLQYATFSTEESWGGLVSSFSKIYQVEPTATDLLVTFPDKSNNNLNSLNTGIENYRIRVDGIDNTNRNVDINNSLHTEELQKAFLNMGIPLNNFTYKELNTDRQLYNRKYNDGADNIILASPLQMTPTEKLVQFNIELGAGEELKDVILFKKLYRQIQPL